MIRVVNVGARGSKLSLIQTWLAIAAFNVVSPDSETPIKIIQTAGDKDQINKYKVIGQKGIFARAIEEELMVKNIDLAIHSYKDLGSEIPEGLIVIPVGKRDDPRDAFISRLGLKLMDMPKGAKIGTSSGRRGGLVKSLRPDFEIVPLRGNVDTRLLKAQTEEYDGIILAATGMIRMGLASQITEYLDLEVITPPPIKRTGFLASEINLAAFLICPGWPKRVGL